MSSTELAEHFFRHEYGKLVAVLVNRVGPEWIEDVEDAVQHALLTGLNNWTHASLPDNPSAWLYRVAHNALISELRKRPRHQELLHQHAAALIPDSASEPEYISDHQIRDDQLLMMFACCEESIPLESSLALSLKVLCGFDVREISLRLFTSEANIYKRLARARARLKEQAFEPDTLNDEQHRTRLPSVHHIVYLLFTEGHLSHRINHTIRKELCEEAIRLAMLLAQHPIGQTPETNALLALMHLHMARIGAREGDAGELVLLEQQDRSQWDRHQIGTGLSWLAKSAAGDKLSRYHVEASIAAEHCLASSFGETHWERIAHGYHQLEQIAPSPVHTLNRAVAVAEWQGPSAALQLLEQSEQPAWMINSYQWAAVLADLHQRAGNTESAEHYRTAAMEQAPTEAMRDALNKRLDTYL